MSPSSYRHRNYGAVCVCGCVLSPCDHDVEPTGSFHYDQFEMHTILHRRRTQRLITPLQILAHPGCWIRWRPTLTVNNWDYPGSSSDVMARRNSLGIETIWECTQTDLQTEEHSDEAWSCGMFQRTVQHFGKFSAFVEWRVFDSNLCNLFFFSASVSHQWNILSSCN